MRLTDLDYSRGDQVGFDFFFKSGITRGLPTMVPIAMLYATPEDAANEIAYLYKRHTRFRGSRWAKKLTASICCPKTTARFTSSLRPQFTN